MSDGDKELKKELKRILTMEYLYKNPRTYPECEMCGHKDMKLGAARWVFDHVTVVNIPAITCCNCNNKTLTPDLLVTTEELLKELNIEVGTVNFMDLIN